MERAIPSTSLWPGDLPSSNSSPGDHKPCLLHSQQHLRTGRMQMDESNLESSQSCPQCKGEGKVICPSCNGEGRPYDCCTCSTPKGWGTVTCPACDGSGQAKHA